MGVYRILHITVHMGGGVGKVLSGIAAYDRIHHPQRRHRILLLEQPEKSNFVDVCRAHDVELIIAPSRDELCRELADTDLVQIEWWHHPVMADLLAHFPQIPMRLILWSHVSGCYYPCMPEQMLRIPMQMVFTSAYSYDNPYWSEDTRRWARAHCPVVNSSGGFDSITAESVPHEGFVLGYVGTQSYAKMHPRFLQYCSSVMELPDIALRMVGDRTNERALHEMAVQYGFADRMHFVGYTADVGAELNQMDVFVYLLNPLHFGTTENALLEAMAAGLPVVCLRQCAEQYLVKDGETGILVDTEADFCKAIEALYRSPDECARLGANARRYVCDHLSAAHTADALGHIYDAALRREKSYYSFKTVFGTHPYEYFLSCLPPDLCEQFRLHIGGEALHIADLPVILRERGKSSLPHFHAVYSQDPILQDWMKEMNTGERSL